MVIVETAVYKQLVINENWGSWGLVMPLSVGAKANLKQQEVQQVKVVLE